VKKKDSPKKERRGEKRGPGLPEGLPKLVRRKKKPKKKAQRGFHEVSLVPPDRVPGKERRKFEVRGKKSLTRKNIIREIGSFERKKKPRKKETS